MMKIKTFIIILSFLNMCAAQNHNIWQRGLYKSLDDMQISLSDTFHNLMQSDFLTYTQVNYFTHYSNLLCGLITSNPKLVKRCWWVNQKSATTLKWEILKFLVHKDSVECFASYVEWTENQKTFRFCGYRLPWQQYSGGNITITQQFLITLKHSSTFTFFFYVISYRKYIEFPFAIFAFIIPQPKRISYDGDVGIYLTGSSPLQILNLNITLLKGSRTEGFVLYDGPSHLCNQIMSYAGDPNRTNENKSKQSFNWEKATSSFQALLVIEVMNMPIVRTLIVTWSATHVKTLSPNLRILNLYRNGLFHLHTISSQPTNREKRNTDEHGFYVTIVSLEFFGPDTFSNTLGLDLCQYGGFWIYGYNNENFPAKTKLFQHCSKDRITYMKLYITWEYAVIAVIQYLKKYDIISKSKGVYEINTHNFERENVRFYPNLHYSEHQKWAVHEKINVLQILAHPRDIATVHFGNSYSKPFQLTFWFHSPEKHCSCQVEIYSKQEWCSTEGLVHYEKLAAPVAVKEGIDPVNITFYCNKCNSPPFIYFSLTQVSSLRERLGTQYKQTDHVLVDPHTCNKPLHRRMQYGINLAVWDIRLHNNYAMALNISLSTSHKRYSKLINVRLNVQIQECNNNTKVLRQYDIKVGQNINLFTQNSMILLSVSHLEEHFFHGNYDPIGTFVYICAISNDTIDGLYWTPKMTER